MSERIIPMLNVGRPTRLSAFFFPGEECGRVSTEHPHYDTLTFIPWGYFEENSQPVIECAKDGVLVMVVNFAHVESMVVLQEPEAKP